MASAAEPGWDLSAWRAVNHGVDVGTTRCRCAGLADFRVTSIGASDRAKPNLWIELRGLLWAFA
jgi:hypothetical protein